MANQIFWSLQNTIDPTMAISVWVLQVAGSSMLGILDRRIVGHRAIFGKGINRRVLVRNLLKEHQKVQLVRMVARGSIL